MCPIAALLCLLAAHLQYSLMTKNSIVRICVCADKPAGQQHVQVHEFKVN
jgi:hypothetical protein